MAAGRGVHALRHLYVHERRDANRPLRDPCGVLRHGRHWQNGKSNEPVPLIVAALSLYMYWSLLRAGNQQLAGPPKTCEGGLSKNLLDLSWANAESR